MKNQARPTSKQQTSENHTSIFDALERKEHVTPCGTIRYWTTPPAPNAPNLVFLPGLTADHRLFEKQIEHFAGKANCLVWDAPSHGESRPFELTWNLQDKAAWLHSILDAEGFAQPVLIGQSMGGYLSQMFISEYPGEARGFISIDSAPLQRSYYMNWEIAFLHHTHAMYNAIPWKLLVSWGSLVATSEYGRRTMRTMMNDYPKAEYVDLTAHGYETLAKAVELNKPYNIDCPARLICGTKDMAGSCKRYSKKWAERTGLPLHWIEEAGHNSNCDAPDEVNAIIERFLEEIDVF